MATATIFDFLLNQQRSSTGSLVNGTVTFYAAGTTSLKAVWADSIAATEAPNPYTLDSRASATVYGIGNYKIVLKDSSDVVIATWDNVYVGADLSSIDLSSVIAAASFSNRDFIGNSRFNIWNGGTSFSITTSTSTSTADGWYYTSNGSTPGTVTVSRQSFTYGQTAVEGNPVYYAKINRTGAASGATSETYGFRLPIQTAAAEEMTFRFNAKAAGALNVTVVCIQNFGSGGSATVTTTSTALGLTTSWQRLYKTFTVPSIAGKTVGSGAYMEIGISFTPNSTYNVDFAECKFETGTVAGADEPRTTYEDDIRTSGTIATKNTLTIADTAGGIDEKYWRMSMDYTSNTFDFEALNDAQSSGGLALSFTRNGTDVELMEVGAPEMLLNTTGGSTTTEGIFRWNPDDHCIEYVTGLGNVVQCGQESWGLGVNKSGATISDGVVVYFSGVQGQRPTFDKAISNDIDKCSLIGIVTASVANNHEGPVTVFGIVNDVDTSAWAEGTKLYLSAATPGALTSTAPSSPNYKIWAATVLYQHGTAGKLFVNPQVALDNYIPVSYLDTDGTLAANSDSKVATQKAVKTYSDTKVPLAYLDTDGTLAANSDSKVATQKAVKTYVTNTAFATALPSQTGNNGKIVTTDGTNASWSALKTINSSSLLGSGDISISSDIIRSARTSNTILGVSDKGNLIDITSSTFTQTFDAAATLGDGWYCYIRNSGTGDITLDPNASETIDGRTSYIMYPGECRLITCTGTAFISVVVSPFIKTFTTTGTFTKPPGYAYFGGIGWGAGASGARSNSASVASRGGGGGMCFPFQIAASKFGTSETITIGAGGPAYTGTSGSTVNAGGDTTIGSLLTIAGATSNNGAGYGLVAANPVGFEGNNGTVANLAVFGGGACSISPTSQSGGSRFGGGAGGGCGAGGDVYSGGTSLHGGNGGAANSASNGADGDIPGGGGGATQTGTQSGAGARGELRIWGVV